MSKCMTIADESVDQKDTCTEIATKDIVEFILEEALLSAFILSDKGCSRIGDFNIVDDFRQQYDQLSYLKDFEQIVHSQKNQSATNQESNLNSGENVDRPFSLITAKENLELIIDSLVKKEDKIKPAGEWTVISEKVLADNELQIKNGQIHIEKNKTDRNVSSLLESQECSNEEREETGTECNSESKANKTSTPSDPLNQSGSPEVECGGGSEQRKEKTCKLRTERENKSVTEDEPEEINTEEDAQTPFEPFATQELGKVLPDSSTDPNRPRACAFAEEDVKKIIKEIEEISFIQGHAYSEDLNVSYLPDGQGDADLESKSFTKSKEHIEKPQKAEKLQEEFAAHLNLGSGPTTDAGSNDRLWKDRQQEIFSSEEMILEENKQSLPYSTNNVVSEVQESLPSSITLSENTPSSRDDGLSSSASSRPPVQEHYLRDKVAEEECLIKSKLYNNESTNGPKMNANQMLNTSFSVDSPPVPLYETDDDLSRNSYVTSKEEIVQNRSVCLTNSANLNESQNDGTEGAESSSLSINARAHSGSKPDEFTLKNLELATELDLKSKGRDDQELIPELNSQSEDKISSGVPNPAGSRTDSVLNWESFFHKEDSQIPSVNSDVFVKKTDEKTESIDGDSFTVLQESNYWLGRRQTDSEKYDMGEDFNLMAEKTGERQEETLTWTKKSAENFQILKKRIYNAESDFLITEVKEKDISLAGVDSSYSQNKKRALEDEESPVKREESAGAEMSQESSASCETQISNHSINENGLSESSEARSTATQKFKLHSQKMYLNANYEPAGQAPIEFTLTESEETFIDMTESILQIIEPTEDDARDACSKISFSLLAEVPNKKFEQFDAESELDLSLEKNDSSEIKSPARKMHSGMTTIGPIKYNDHDPKDLTGPEIDYGKMTRITSSRQLAKDMSLFSSEVTTALSVKIIEEGDSDDNASLGDVAEEDRLERSALINRDIASLTKVQKVREVMSYRPKSEEDFEDEEVLPRPRLDLKDVESMTDERYKVPDVGIPLLSFEIGDGNLDAEKELVESMGLVISGLTSPSYCDEGNAEVQGNQAHHDSDCVKQVDSSDDDAVNKQNPETLTENSKGGTSETTLEKKNKSNVEFVKEVAEENTPEESWRVSNSDSQHESASSHLKYGTLGSVFRKASSKFMRKDGEFFMRNSRSLPRDTFKISATDSIRSILDDCQSSASSMLKKSRSLLKNTQSILKSISQSRVTVDQYSGPGANQKKVCPSESDVRTIERKLSGFLKKEDFTKAKNLIKSKVEKTFRNFDPGTSTACESESSTPAFEKQDLRLTVRNEENLRVDQMENFRKLIPKSPLVYKSQFVKSQMSFQSNPPEPVEVSLNCLADDDQEKAEEIVKISLNEDRSERMPDENSEYKEEEAKGETCFQEKLQWLSGRKDLDDFTIQESEPQQPDYIEMETIQGLSTADLRTRSDEQENLNTGIRGPLTTEKENDLKKTEASNSLQIFTDGSRGNEPCSPEVNEDILAMKTPSERKMKTKKKKLTARFRSFWCSAFGRVKTPPKKGDLS